MSARFTVTKALPMLWRIHDAHTFRTEFVLFADYGIGHARATISDEYLDDAPGARDELLRELASVATSAGVQHSFQPPPRLVPLTRFGVMS